MFKKFILVAALFAMVTAQALAVNCDLRCALMGDASGVHSCSNRAQIASRLDKTAHCHGMRLHSDNEPSASLSGHECGISICKAGLVDINRSSTQGEELSNATSELLPALSILPFEATTWSHSAAHRYRSKQRLNIPLDLRPGSSLRI